MIRAFSLSAISWVAFWFFQGFDIFTVLDKYGFPTALAVGMFFYFRGQMRATAEALIQQQTLTDGYRKETLTEAKSQTEFLRKLLAEFRGSSVCKFEGK